MRKFDNTGARVNAGLEDDKRPTSIELPEGSDEPVDLSGVEQDSAEIEKHETELNDAKDAVVGLEAIAMSIQSTLSGRGMDRTAAMFAHIATARCCDALKLKNTLPSLENFGATNSQLMTTRAGLEDVKQKIVDGWKYIIDLIQSGLRKINEYYQRVWAQAPRLIAKAQQIQKKEAELKTGVSKEAGKLEIDKSSMANIHLNKDANGAILASGLNVLSDLSGQIFVDYVKNVNEWGEKVVDAMGNMDYADDDRFKASVDTLLEAKLDVDALFPAADKASGEGNNVGGKETSEILGGKKIFVHKATATGTEDDNDPEGQAKQAANDAGAKTAGAQVDLGEFRAYSNSVTEARVYLGSASDKEAEVNEKSVATFTRPEIKNIANSVEQLCTIIMNYKAGNKRANDLRQKAVTAAKRAQTNSVKANDLSKDNSTAAGSLHKIVGAVNTLLTQPNQAFSAHMLRVCSISLALCEKSLANYK